MLFIRTPNATIINYRARCRIDPADTAPVTAAVRQRPRPLKPLSYAEPGSPPSTLQMTATIEISCHRQWHTNADFMQELFTFWNNVTFTPTTADKTGISWLEILIWFELTTGNRTPASLKLAPTVPGPLAPLTHTSTLVRNFRNASKIIIHQTSCDPNIKALIHACPHARTRLRDIGTHTTLSGMAICPHIPRQTQRDIACITLRFITPTSNREIELFHGGN